MAQSKHTGRTCVLLTRSGLVTAFLTGIGAAVAAESARADGNVHCWGKDSYGQCYVPSDLGACSSVAGTINHTVALQSTGRVRSWGLNWAGQCNTPPDLGMCTIVAGGADHSIALRADGIVQCWGSPSQGQCNTPPDLGTCISIAAGAHHTIALRADAMVRCWGNNNYGQCYVPSELGTCSSIAGGNAHSIALRSNGMVRCWGNNNYGQCDTPSDIGTCINIAAGAFHTVALRADGIVRCWGSNDYGQCNAPSDLGTCSSVAAGGYHTIVVDGPPPVDTDGDGRPDSTDNCPTIANPLQADCNSNGIGDACEVADGAEDFNGDTIPDTCQCLADLFVDHQVNGADLGVLLAFWGPANPALPSADINRDGVVNGADLGYLLNAWGQCPTVVVPAWATVIEAQPDPAVVTDPLRRSAISATGLPWRVLDTQTQTEMLLVPPGSFWMGCVIPLDLFGYDNSIPAHRVTLTNPFYLARYELTQSEWEAALGSNSNPSVFRDMPDSPLHPVERVDWESVQGYLGATGTRLPTEAEWEYACRAGIDAPLYSGATDESGIDSIAWYRPNSNGKTHVGGGKIANGFGFYDMLGNVWELVNDFNAPYTTGAVTNPTGPSSGFYRVIRGGDIDIMRATTVTSYSRQAAALPAVIFIGVRIARNP